MHAFSETYYRLYFLKLYSIMVRRNMKFYITYFSKIYYVSVFPGIPVKLNGCIEMSELIVLPPLGPWRRSTWP